MELGANDAGPSDDLGCAVVVLPKILRTASEVPAGGERDDGPPAWDGGPGVYRRRHPHRHSLRSRRVGLEEMIMDEFLHIVWFVGWLTVFATGGAIIVRMQARTLNDD